LSTDDVMLKEILVCVHFHTTRSLVRGHHRTLFPVSETALQRKWWKEHKISVNHRKRRDHLGDQDGRI